MTTEPTTSPSELWQYLSTALLRLPAKHLLHSGDIEDIKRTVPSKPGVYAIFYADSDRCFYVGKAVHSMRKRLVDHYRKDARADYRGLLHKLSDPQDFRFWFHQVRKSSNSTDHELKCLLTAVEAVISAAWKPEVVSRHF
jgi:hypothetical protein